MTTTTAAANDPHTNQVNIPDKICLSIIIPAFNEQDRIADSLYLIKDYLSAQDYHSEIIVVDDGSSDLTTEIVKFIDIYGQTVNEHDEGLLMENIKNVGKGFSIARGMTRAQGDIVLFTDADLSTPISEVEKILPYFDEGYDVVIGSRNLPDSVIDKKPWYRDVMSGVFRLAVHFLSIKGIKDTQCGFKAYRKEVAHTVADKQKIYGFGFDVEHLFIAKKLGYKIKEVPIEWSHQEGSTVSPVSDSFDMFKDLLKIRWSHKKLNTSKN